MSKEKKEILKALSEDKELVEQLSDLYRANPEGFIEDAAHLLQEKGFDATDIDFNVGQDLSLEELRQIAGGQVGGRTPWWACGMPGMAE